MVILSVFLNWSSICFCGHCIWPILASGKLQCRWTNESAVFFPPHSIWPGNSLLLWRVPFRATSAWMDYTNSLILFLCYIAPIWISGVNYDTRNDGISCHVMNVEIASTNYIHWLGCTTQCLATSTLGALLHSDWFVTQFTKPVLFKRIFVNYVSWSYWINI